MKGVKFAEKVLIGANQVEVFDFTQDYDNRLSWDTFLKKAELIDGAIRADKNVRAYCVSKNGLAMLTEYVSFNRPKSTAVKMIKGPYIFKSFLGSWTFKEISNRQTEVTFLYSFELRFPFTLLTYYIRRNLKNNVKQRLIDLKTKVEGRSANR
jgi:ribosome-associated toxin RatA of RatAB toxin-antitoxin module